MHYRNTRTGAEFESQCIISSPDLIVIEDVPPKKEDQAPVKEEPVTPKKTVTKPASKKTTKKGARK